jgi:hypothetical protein
MQPEITHVVAASPVVSVAYTQRRFIAERVFPRVPVNDLQGKYFKYSKQMFRSQVTSMAPGAFPRFFTLDLDAFGFYYCQGNSIAVELPDAVRNHADDKPALDLIHQNTALGIIAVVKELEAIALINTTQINQNTTLSGTAKWSDYINSDPITAIVTQIETIQQAIGVDADNMKLLLPRPVWRTLQRHPQVREDIKYTQNLLDKPVAPDNLAAALGISEVIIVDNLQLTSTEGQTDILSYTWGNIALLYYHTGAPSRLTPNFGYTFWSTPDSYPIKRVRNEMNDADYFKSQEFRHLLLVEPNAGFLWNTPI